MPNKGSKRSFMGIVYELLMCGMLTFAYTYYVSCRWTVQTKHSFCSKICPSKI